MVRMKNIFLAFFLISSSLCFSQKISDFINFDSLNTQLIDSQVTEMIISKRLSLGSTNIIQDKVTKYSAKYHTTYFEKYGDQSSKHTIGLFLDITNSGNKSWSLYDTPSNRIFSIGFLLNKNYIYDLVLEESKFYKIDSRKITYQELIESIYLDLISNKQTILDFSNDIKYIGVSSGIHKSEYDEITFSTTLVIGSRKQKV